MRQTTHVRINHAVTGAVKTIPVPTEGHVPSCAITSKKSSSAHAPKELSESSVKEKSYNLQAATTRSKEVEKFYCIHLV